MTLAAVIGHKSPLEKRLAKGFVFSRPWKTVSARSSHEKDFFAFNVPRRRVGAFADSSAGAGSTSRSHSFRAGPSGALTAEGNPTTPGQSCPQLSPITTPRPSSAARRTIPLVSGFQSTSSCRIRLGTATGQDPTTASLESCGSPTFSNGWGIAGYHRASTGFSADLVAPVADRKSGEWHHAEFVAAGRDLSPWMWGVRLLACCVRIAAYLAVLQALSASGLPNHVGTASNAPVNFVNRFTMISNRLPAAPASPAQRPPLMPTGR